ncbi:outer membrane protein assembly factor BamD [Candidatus Thioglobus sp.]|nr:outer membrane protein assembly factor BamD [Candidatus Thioglobus sp.]
MKFRLLFTLPLMCFLTGCSVFGVNNDTKNLVADGLTPKELYEQAEDKIDAGSIEQAIDQYELILSSYSGSKYAIQARLDIAFNLLKQKKYNRSITTLNQFIEKYPNIPATPYAYYLRGVAAEKKSSSILDKLITDSAQRDVESVRDAYNYFVELIQVFPNSKYAEDAKTKLTVLRNTLARHEFYVALYYTDISSNIAAINRSKYIIENYPNSATIPDALDLMAHNYDIIGADDLAADVREVLNSSFPSYSPSYSLK